MATPRPEMGGTAARDPREPRGKMPSSPLRNALQLLHQHLLFNDAEGIDVGSALASIEEKVGIRPRPALREAVRMGFVEVRWSESHWRKMVRRGPRNAELLRWVYGGAEPPSLEWFDARVRARRAAEEAGRARLKAIREVGRPKADNTAGALPAWLP